jgi:hypothetical protein
MNKLLFEFLVQSRVRKKSRRGALFQTAGIFFLAGRPGKNILSPRFSERPVADDEREPVFSQRRLFRRAVADEENNGG